MSKERITQLQEDKKTLEERIEGLDLVITRAKASITTEKAKLKAVDKELEGLIESRIESVAGDCEIVG